MDEDHIQTIRERIAACTRKIGLSFDNAKKATKLSQGLLDKYRSSESKTSGVAAFRLDAYLSDISNLPCSQSELSSIAQALRARIAGNSSGLGKSDLRISLELHSSGYIGQEEVEFLVKSMKGVDDFSILAEADRLISCIGSDFIQDYLSSNQLFETDGMGGEQRPLIREMAEEALTKSNFSK